MIEADFLRDIWPAHGLYALAIPFLPPGAKHYVYSHKIFTNIDEAAAEAHKLARYKDVYFCVHSLKEAKIWNAKKINPKTGTQGAYETRVQSNMLASRALFFDLDIGSSTGKFNSQAEAIIALKTFTTITHLPKPYIVSSGGGLHVYWRLDDDILSANWLDLAIKLRALAKHYELKFDPSRTTDSASVLRVAGTFNHKQKNNLRRVEILTTGDNPVSAEYIDDILTQAIRACGITTPQKKAPAETLLGSNLNYFSGPPVSFSALVKACHQIQTVLAVKGNVSEPLWYATLGVVRYCENGRKAAHFISSGHPEYSQDETDKKLHQLELKSVGPTTCARFELLNPGKCDACSRKGVVTTPLNAARQTETAPSIVITTPNASSITLPDPPTPFLRLKSGAIGIELGSKKNESSKETVVILPYDFYPVRRMHDFSRREEIHVWRANLPRVGYTEIMIPADAMYDRRQLSSTLAHNGIFPHEGFLDHLRAYMVAYINKLQEAADVEVLHSALGWNDAHTQFVLVDKVLHADGSITPSNLSEAAIRATTAIRKAGNAETQIELLRFFGNKVYAANQFSICAALGAPLFFATGHHGVVINMSGPPGASKSTTLYTGASLWGDPLSFCINGTTRGATHNARDNRMTITANLPQMVDEITRMQPKDAADLAMGVTQSEGRIRLTVTGMEQKTLQSNKSTIMLCTANTSLYTILSAERADSTAESMRVFEMQFDVTNVHQKHEADDYLMMLRNNYGHIGEIFLSYVVRHVDSVSARVREIMREIDNRAQIQSSERFWSAAAAASLAACEIARKLGLLIYDPQVIWEWLLTKQIPKMRGIIVEQYTPPVGVLSEYMESINANILVLHRGSVRNADNIPNIIRQPEHGQLLARLEQDTGLMWVLKKPFKDYCVKHGYNFTRIIDSLEEAKVITKKHDRKVLGGGTTYAKGQSWCFVVDMECYEMSGKREARKNRQQNAILQFPTNTTDDTLAQQLT